MKFIIIIFSIFLILPSFGAEFGEYQYTKYLGIQQALQNQRNLAQKRASKYNQSPTRNIRYPDSSNPYPNIQKTVSQVPLTPSQRYSARYYEKYY